MGDNREVVTWMNQSRNKCSPRVRAAALQCWRGWHEGRKPNVAVSSGTLEEAKHRNIYVQSPELSVLATDSNKKEQNQHDDENEWVGANSNPGLLVCKLRE